MLNNPNDPTAGAKAAHKAMPLLTMLMPNDLEWLVELTPERIQTTEVEKREELVERFKRVLLEIKGQKSPTPQPLPRREGSGMICQVMLEGMVPFRIDTSFHNSHFF